MNVDKNRILNAFAKVRLDAIENMKQKCITCPRYITQEEYTAGEGSCFKCWDK